MGDHRRDRRIRVAILSGALGLALASTTGAARADCPPDAAAHFYADARRAFEDKRFDDSIALLRQASACDPNPIYLGNIARAYEEANRLEDALAAWRAYLEVAPDDRERKMTAGRISALSKVVEDLERLEREKKAAEEATRRAEAAARERAAAPPENVAPPPRVSAGAWIVTATGAAGLVAGIVLGLLANSEHASAVQESDVGQAETLQSNARAFALATNVAFVAGGVVAAGGVTWIGIDLFRAPASAPSVGLVMAGPTVSIAGRF